eukprot:365619-Chlamydomonas_euryale.AAC.2
MLCCSRANRIGPKGSYARRGHEGTTDAARAYARRRTRAPPPEDASHAALARANMKRTEGKVADADGRQGGRRVLLRASAWESSNGPKILARQPAAQEC